MGEAVQQLNWRFSRESRLVANLEPSNHLWHCKVLQVEIQLDSLFTLQKE